MVAHSRTPLRLDRLRPLNLPRLVQVDLDNRTMPTVVSGAGPRNAVEAIGEIWRVDDEWWRDRIARRYIEVMLQGGGHVVLYEDLVTGDWWMQNM